MPTKINGRICWSCVNGTPKAMQRPYAANVDNNTVPTPHKETITWDSPGAQPSAIMMPTRTTMIMYLGCVCIHEVEWEWSKNSACALCIRT